MIRLAVGQPYIPGMTGWPEGIDFNLLKTGAELRLFLEAPSEDESSAWRKAPLRVALFREGDAAFLLAKPGDLPWVDVSFHHQLTPRDQRLTDFSIFEQAHLLMTVLLVDAATGLLCGIRMVTLPPPLGPALVGVAEEQLSSPFDEDAYRHRVKGIAAKNPTDELARRADFRVLAGSQRR